MIQAQGNWKGKKIPTLVRTCFYTVLKRQINTHKNHTIFHHKIINQYNHVNMLTTDSLDLTTLGQIAALM